MARPPRGQSFQITAGVSRVSAGYWHTLFIKGDSSLWGMGLTVACSSGNTCRSEDAIQLVSGSVVAADAAAVTAISSRQTEASGYWAMMPADNRNQSVQVAAGGGRNGAGNHKVFIKIDGSLWGVEKHRQPARRRDHHVLNHRSRLSRVVSHRPRGSTHSLSSSPKAASGRWVTMATANGLGTIEDAPRLTPCR